MDGDDNNNKRTLMNEFQREAEQGYSALPLFDPAEYKQYTQGFDLTEEQTHELLLNLWKIMAAFVDRGFRVDSLANVLPGLAQLSGNCEIQEAEDTTANTESGAAKGAAPEEEQPP